MKRTKIVCTIGPATDTKLKLKRLMKAGMNVCRLNFSHNVHAYHLKVMKSIRSVAKELKLPVAVLLDLQGPRIRLGDLPEKGLVIKKGQKVVLTTGKDAADKIPVTYNLMHEDVEENHRILIADGLINLIVEKVKGKNIYTRVVNGGKLLSHKGINLPDTAVQVPALSEKDKKDLFFGVKNKVDFVALSFVRTAKEVADLKRLIKKYERQLGYKDEQEIQVIVKIERREAIDNIDEIIQITDGVMVARGDLGIELPAEDVPLMQKMLIDKCLEHAKPVIVATQMLESMINNPRPTRAEVSDVANAVIDHTDAVMLSGETATGSFPVETVEYMSRIVAKTEKSTYDDLVIHEKIKQIVPTSQAISGVAKVLAEQVKSKFILVASRSGESGRIVSRYRPELPVLVACKDERVRRQLNLSWGIEPFMTAPVDDMEKLISRSITKLKKSKRLKENEQIIVVSSTGKKEINKLNLVEIVTV
jgi:pyruvate kinase